MLACFFGRRPKIGSGRLRQVRPSLELLETRDCPSAAVITSFTAINTDGYHVQLSGQVTDESPGTCVVQLGGPSALQGRTVPVNTDGTFSITVEIPQECTWVATAKATDMYGLESDLAYYASP